jgi:hypothetical protein
MIKPEKHHEHNQKKPHEKNDHIKMETDTAFNTPENALKAIETCRACIVSLAPGPVWRHTAPRGEFEIKGCLTQNEQPVTVFNFSPVDGSILPKGLRALSGGKLDVMPKVVDSLSSMANQLRVLEGAEFREPEFCWAVPIAHQGRMVGHIKVSADGTTIMPDRKAIDELVEYNKNSR